MISKYTVLPKGDLGGGASCASPSSSCDLISYSWQFHLVLFVLHVQLTSSDAVLPDNLQENTHLRPPSSPLSPFSPVSPFSPPSKPFSPPESDDGVSVVSSASALHHKFTIPDTWRPSIMVCIQQPTDEERKMQLTPKI